MRRVTAATLVAVLLLSLGVGTASASHTANPRADIITLTCENVGEITVVAGPGNAAHIVGSGRTLVGHSFAWALIVDGEVVDEEVYMQGKKKGLQDRLVTCIATWTAEDDPEFAEEIRQEFELGPDADIQFRLTVRALFPGGGGP
jgi:hypothetical protein